MAIVDAESANHDHSAGNCKQSASMGLLAWVASMGPPGCACAGRKQKYPGIVGYCYVKSELLTYRSVGIRSPVPEALATIRICDEEAVFTAMTASSSSSLPRYSYGVGACAKATPDVIHPKVGSSRGGVHLRWSLPGVFPEDMYINGRSCAALDGGIFVAPKDSRATSGGNVDVTVVFGDGRTEIYPAAFSYYTPGSIECVDPRRVPITGGRQVRIRTTDLGMPITEVFLGGVQCTLIGEATATGALVLVPNSKEGREGPASVECRAGNGNSACSESALLEYFVPSMFGHIGRNIKMSTDRLTVTRIDGVNCGVCLGAYPLRRYKDKGRYFQIVVEEMYRSPRSLALGVTVRQDEDSMLMQGRIRGDEVTGVLQRAWVAGYDRGNALFLSDGEETKIPPSAWRPVTDVKVGTTIGVLWAESLLSPALIIYQDGVERARLPVTGRLPSPEEELFAVVDLQGNVRSVSLFEDARFQT